MISRRLALAAVAPLVAGALCAGLAGCYANEPKPPMSSGVCYSMIRNHAGEYKFNIVAKNVADLEHCAGNLEAMRVKFISLGGSRYEVWGVYQGQYIYINGSGLFSSQYVHGPQYPLLVRTGDGRLVRPGTTLTH